MLSPIQFPSSQPAARSPASYARNQGEVQARGQGGVLDLDRAAQKLGQRVNQLGQQVTSLAGNFLGQFASQVLGEDAKDLQFSFDSFSLSSQASLTYSRQSVQQGNASLRSEAMEYAEGSTFTGRGTITTKDGRQFEFEIEVSYSATLASSATVAQSAEGAPALAADFDGNAADLFDRLTPEPVRLPFQFQLGGQDVLGSLLAKVLDLPDGPRYLDLRQEPNARRLDVQA
ncbi:hypothetical protein [Chitinimonas sp. BJYL2]|uniref:hypothetical protein n=1 Tax=Chitinimonas sp. BJYL2 TaxID=2976696 RepID=UPI0022B3F29C|nr:hypothetical protein [Chitinimonas sp. BJYL2]